MPAASPDKLLQQLPQGKFSAAIVLQGTDHYLRGICRNKIIEAVVPEGARDWAVTRVSARDASWEEILGLAQMRPMLADRQVVIIDGAEHVEELGEKSRDTVLATIEKYLKSPAPFTVLVIEATSLDGRQKFSKLLNDKALVVSLTIGPESAALLAMQMAKELGTEIDRDAAALVADIMNGEPAHIRIELEKLSTYALGRRIVKKDVEDLVVAARKNTVWQFAEMLANRQRGPAFEFLSNLLREGEQPAALVGALAWRYRTLIESHDSRFSRKSLLVGLADLAEA
ncbi:MAG: DNA polymerase III subunit delta, partial [Chthoniobacterales bacterium]